MPGKEARFESKRLDSERRQYTKITKDISRANSILHSPEARRYQSLILVGACIDTAILMLKFVDPSVSDTLVLAVGTVGTLAILIGSVTDRIAITNRAHRIAKPAADALLSLQKDSNQVVQENKRFLHSLSSQPPSETNPNLN